MGVEVKFVGSMRLKLKKKYCLVISRNKQKFILMVSEKFQHRGFQTIHAEGDADSLICQTAVDSASRHTTTLIGDNTDLLVLLCFHVNPNSFNLYFRSEAEQTTNRKPRIRNIKWLRKH